MHDTRQYPDPTPGFSAAPMQFSVHLTDDQLPAFAAALAPALARELLKHSNTPALPNSPGAIDPDTPYPVQEICKELGKHKPKGRISHLTFQKRYIDTGKLTYCDPPPNGSRAKRYVRLGDWQALQIQIQQKKK